MVEPPAAGSPVATSKHHYRGRGWVAGKSRDLDSRSDGQFHWLQVEGVGEFWVSACGSSCGSVSVNDLALSEETILGPGLTLSLAAQGTYCLHASAVELPEVGAVAFAGESGVGKSTLAAALDHSAPGCRRVADDILALGSDPAHPTVRRDFPQPQLAIDQQPHLARPTQVNLRAICLLEPSASTGDSIRLEPLPPPRALTTIIGQTVVSKLFDQEMLQRHFSFSAALAANVPAFLLSYPWRPASIPQVFETLSSRLSPAAVSDPGTTTFQE